MEREASGIRIILGEGERTAAELPREQGGQRRSCCEVLHLTWA